MLLLHAIASADAPFGRNVGLRGAPLHRVVDGALAAYATHFGAAPDLGRADLLANHEFLMRLDDCLPVRFPTWFDDEPALRAYVRQHAARLLKALERLRGMCELAMTAVWTSALVEPHEPLSVATPGTRYLLERQRSVKGSELRRKRAIELRELLEHAAVDHAIEQKHHVWPSQSVALSSALLIPRSAADEFRARLLDALGSQQDVRILVNGPWPPYTFAAG
jgi:Gas vesicle synthesis protein GvpL/GvpF